MTKESVLALLRQQGDYLSGQEMSRQLGLSRAAIWKAVQALREEYTLPGAFKACKKEMGL